MTRYPDVKKLALRVAGLKTLDEIAAVCGVKRSTAQQYVQALKRAGHVKSVTVNEKKQRLYYILPEQLRRVHGFPESLDRYSAVKVYASDVSLKPEVLGRMVRAENGEYFISLEDTIVLAVGQALSSGESRMLLAAISMFRKKPDWHVLSELASETGVAHIVGALYEIAKKMYGLRRLSDPEEKRLAGAKPDVGELEGSGQFGDIELKWKVKLPLTFGDLEKLREWQ